MNKILSILCLLIITTGVVSAHPVTSNGYGHSHFEHKEAPPPKPAPLVYQVPVKTPVYSEYNSSPYVTFFLGNIDVTLGI